MSSKYLHGSPFLSKIHIFLNFTNLILIHTTTLGTEMRPLILIALWFLTVFVIRVRKFQFLLYLKDAVGKPLLPKQCGNSVFYSFNLGSFIHCHENSRCLINSLSWGSQLQAGRITALVSYLAHCSRRSVQGMCLWMCRGRQFVGGFLLFPVAQRRSI